MTELNYSKKQIKPLIEKFDIDVENNDVFKTIIMMFDGKTNYQVWAIKSVFENEIPFSFIEKAKKWSDENHSEIQNLIMKNLVSYKTKEDFKMLFSEMEGLEKIKFVKDSINKFNTRQRSFMKKEIIADVENGLSSYKIECWYELFKKMMTLPKHRIEKLISTSSALENVQDIASHINNALNKSYSWNKEDFLGFLKRNCSDCKIVYDNNDIVIITVNSFESSKKLCGGGRTGWCLTREESYFRRYVLEPSNAIQYFLFDFSKKEDNELAHVGFTVRDGYGITNAHSTKNHSLTGDGFTIDGNRINISSVLSNNNIPQNVFIHLHELKEYEWNLKSVLKVIESNLDDYSISYSKGNKLIVRIMTRSGLRRLIGHTLINDDNLDLSNQNKIYLLFDFEQDVNDNNSLICLDFVRDMYETDSLYRIIDAFNSKLDKNYLKSVKINLKDFLNCEKIKPEILLHKLIDENEEDEVVKLISSNKDLDVNYIFNHRAPIFSIIDKKMLKAFKEIINHKNFDSSSQNSYGEALLQSLLYDYQNDGNSDEDNENLKKMIDIIISSDEYDLNAINLNDDSAINVAAEKPSLLWVVEKLVTNPKVNVNVINDFNCSSFTNAIRRNNIKAAKLIGQRPDLFVRKEDINIANKMGLNMKDLVNPKINSDETIEYVSTPKISNFDFASIFEDVLASR